ncbi:unnamed protein product [Lathyrus oleraceus]
MVYQLAIMCKVRLRCPSISLWVEFFYGQTSKLYLGGIHIMSATRVKQGDPLGPLLFSIVLHALILHIRGNCKLLLHALDLDDETVIRDSEEVAKALDIILETGSDLSLELNIYKTDIFWPLCDGNKLCRGCSLRRFEGQC